MYSFLFNKHVIFLLHFLKTKLFLFIESINKFYLLYFYLPGSFSCYSLASAKLWLTKRSSCPAIISYSWAATRLASMTASLICWAFSLKCFRKQEKKRLNLFPLFNTQLHLYGDSQKLVSYNDLFSWSSQVVMRLLVYNSPSDAEVVPFTFWVH